MLKLDFSHHVISSPPPGCVCEDFKPPPGLEQPHELQLYTELPEGRP